MQILLEVSTASAGSLPSKELLAWYRADEVLIVLEKPPYKVSETGWGEFTIQIRIQFVNEASEKPLAFQHGLKLHHWGPPIEGEPLSANIDASLQPRTMSQPPVNGDASTPAVAEGSSTPAQGNPDGDVAVKAETSTPRPDVVMGDNEDTGTPAAGTPGGSQPPGAGTIETHQTRAQSLAQSAAEQRISVAAKYPVYSWQYDELVFSDPPLALFNLMNENPPTPLPAKNRRPRDQRDGFESKKKAKSGVTRNATAGSSKLAGTPIAGAVGTPAEAIKEGSTAPNVDGEGGGNGTAPGTPSAAPVVGIPGEPGSADVPLEFTNEMERAEHNKLHMARRKIIDEMDRWRWVTTMRVNGESRADLSRCRSKLIEQEKELAKVKEEMQAAA